MTEAEEKTMPGSWSILGRHQELDLKTLTLPWSVHVHQDEWRKGEIRPILTDLLQLSIKNVSFSGLTEDNIREVLTRNADFFQYNARFVYAARRTQLSKSTRELIKTTEYNTMHNKPGLTVAFISSLTEARAALTISPGENERLSEDYLVEKIVEYSKAHEPVRKESAGIA